MSLFKGEPTTIFDRHDQHRIVFGESSELGAVRLELVVPTPGGLPVFIVRTISYYDLKPLRTQIDKIIKAMEG